MQFGTRLKLWRKAKGLKQRQVAEKLGISASAVSYWEDGSTYPTHRHQEEAAGLFGLTLAQFYSKNPPAVISHKKRRAS